MLDMWLNGYAKVYTNNKIESNWTHFGKPGSRRQLRLLGLRGSLAKTQETRQRANGKKAVGLDKQNNNFASTSGLFVAYFAVVARLRR